MSKEISSTSSNLTVLLLSSQDSRGTLIAIAKNLYERAKNGNFIPQDINTKVINEEVACRSNWPSISVGLDTLERETSVTVANTTNSGITQSGDFEPDLLMILGPHIELEGYPPWHIRSTEMYCTGERASRFYWNKIGINYLQFFDGLRLYGVAEKRNGR